MNARLRVMSRNAISIIRLLGHCFTTWYVHVMSRSLVKLTEIGTSRGVARQGPYS